MAESSVVRRGRARHRGSSNPNFRGGSLRSCNQCGAAIWVTPSKARRHKNHFCKSDCRDKWLSSVRGASTSNYKGGEVITPCAECGIKFNVPRAEHNRGFGKFCSRRCWRASFRPPMRDCIQCGKKFRIRAANAKFCSRPCQYAGKRKIRTPREIAQRKLEVRIASLMGYSLKGRKAGCRWETLVGYTLADLMAHLESLFAPGMTWSNIGEWHIDHRRPRSSFVYDSPADPEFHACWSLANLQPLWAVDNMTKGARLDWRPAA